ncbi:MAG: hypothetical protein ACJAVI_005729 [Candidatus Azotimanducaceae bacterium]|jgi:hypothetical protein
MIKTIKSACTILVLVASSLANGFGANGHRIIGEIASNHLSTEAKEQIRLILDSFPLAFEATWPDEMRSAGGSFWSYEASLNWHFINVPRRTTYEKSPQEPKGDSYTALKAFVAILKGEEVPEGAVKAALEKELNGDLYSQKAKRYAVSFIVHIVGDIHQPLHLGYKSDNGGNSISTHWFGEERNLHDIWDVELVETQQLSYSELARKIDRLTPEKKANIQSATTMDWINESLKLRLEAYDTSLLQGNDSDDDYKYSYIYVPVIEDQMVKAGLRAAALFNSIYAD